MEELEELINDPTKGDITKTQTTFRGKEGTIIYQLENLLKNFMLEQKKSRIIIDEWLLPSLFFSSIYENKREQLKELLEFDSTLLITKDLRLNSVFHALAATDNNQDALNLILASFKSKEDINSMLNCNNQLKRTPLFLALSMRNRK